MTISYSQGELTLAQLSVDKMVFWDIIGPRDVVLEFSVLTTCGIPCIAGYT